MAAQRMTALLDPEVDAEEAERTIEAHFALRQHLIRGDRAWLHRGDGLLGRVRLTIAGGQIAWRV